MTRHKRQSARPGFTFVEFLVYFLILGIILAAVTSFMFDVIQTRTRVRVVAEVEQNMRFSIQRMLRAVRTADGLDAGGSVFGHPDGVLSLDMSVPSVSPTVFDIADGVLRITEGAGTSTPLTTPDVVVDKLWLSRDNLSGDAKTITIQMEVRSRNADGGSTFKYVSSTSSTAVIRKQR